VYFLTLDIGTTALKCCIFDTELRIVKKSSVEYTLNISSEGHITLDPEIYWQSIVKAVGENISNISPSDITAVGVTTQGETLISIDREGSPLTDAVVWLDARAEEEARFLRSRISDDEYYAHTGISAIDPANPICKLLWFKNNAPEIYEAAYKFLLLEDYILFRLSGKFITEDSIMSSTGYLDITTGKLWDKILDAASIDSAKIPDITRPGTVVGKLTEHAAQDLGISPGIPVICGAMDQVCSAVGAGNVRPGIITETTGTALAVCATVERFCPNPKDIYRSAVFRHVCGRYIMMPYNPTAGIILKWFKEQFMESKIDYIRIDRMSAEGAAGKNGLFVIPHFAGKLSPEYAGAMKGAFIGLTLNTKTADLLRAIMESIAFMLRENIDMLNAMSVETRAVYSLGGGANSAFWSQLKADICRVPIRSLTVSESTSLGMAVLMATAMGYYSSVDEIAANIAPDYREYTPSANNNYEEIYVEYLKADKLMRKLYETTHD